MDYLKAIIFFSVFFVGSTQAAINPFKITDITVRAKGVTTKPSIFQELLAKPAKANNPGGATLGGKQGLKVGKTDFELLLEKPYKPADIASAAAGAIMGKTVPGLIAGLALPYVIDAVTGNITKTIPVSPTAPNYAYTNLACTASTGTQYVASGGYSGHYYMSVAACQSQGRQAGFQYSCGDYKCKNLTTNQWVAGPWTGTTSCISGYSVDGTQCKSTQPISCTAPSYYDQATQMCIGSAINEPANAATLEADIYDTFHNTPTAAPLALDELMIKNNVPVNSTEPTTVEDIPANTVSPPTTLTEIYNGFDPATSHPTTTTKTSNTTHELTKSGPSEVQVTNITNTTTNVTDNVTNITTTTTDSSTEHPETQQQLTDCEKNPNAAGCADLGTPPTAETIPVIDQPITLNPTSLGAGTCPTPQIIDMTLMGDITMSYQPYCDFASNIRPLVIAFAWLTAGFMVVRTARES